MVQELSIQALRHERHARGEARLERACGAVTQRKCMASLSRAARCSRLIDLRLYLVLRRNVQSHNSRRFLLTVVDLPFQRVARPQMDNVRLDALNESEARNLLADFLSIASRGCKEMLSEAEGIGLETSFATSTIAPLMEWALPCHTGSRRQTRISADYSISMNTHIKLSCAWPSTWENALYAITMA